MTDYTASRNLKMCGVAFDEFAADFLRFYACAEDWSNKSPDEPLPEEVVSGKEPLFVIGAIAGG